MSAFLDANVLIRHLTGDPPGQARRATAFLKGVEELLLPDLIVAEVVYVLESFYEVERQRVAELVRAIIGFRLKDIAHKPELGSHHQHSVASLGGGHHLLCLRHTDCQWLLAQHVGSALETEGGDFRV